MTEKYARSVIDAGVRIYESWRSGGPWVVADDERALVEAIYEAMNTAMRAPEYKAQQEQNRVPQNMGATFIGRKNR